MQIQNVTQSLTNCENEIKNLRLKLKNEIMIDTQTRINKEIKQIQKDDFRSLKYYKKIKQQVRKRSPIEANFVIDENKQKITNKTPVERIKGAAVIERYFDTLYNELNDFDEYIDWTNLVELSNQQKRNLFQTENNIQFNMYDLKKIIRSLKNNKATGIDGITNEILKMLDDQNLETFLEILNRLYKHNLVPEAWNIGVVTMLYKGKGSKGDPANYRGITVNSNIVKIVEKLMYSKYYKQIDLTELQGGSKKGSSTRDHIFILLTLMKKYKRNGLHIVFLDISKAFDKAWREGIMYILDKRGCNKKDWVYMDLLNVKNKVKIKTTFGETNEIKTNKIIKQGAVSSPIQFGLLIDEIGKELIQMKKGVILDSSNIPCLLWVDDIVTQNQKFDEIQEMLDKIYEMSKKYKLKFGDDKCKHMILSDDLEPTRFLYLGDIKLKKVESYKYLGIMMNKTCNLADHLKYLNGKMTSAVSKISNVTSEYILRNLRVETIKLMIENTMNPILGYGLEPYKIGIGEMENLQNKQGKAIKDIFGLNRFVPNLAMPTTRSQFGSTTNSWTSNFS